MKKQKNDPNKSFKTELSFTKCKHDLVIKSSTEISCKKCGAGWTGKDVYKLLSPKKS